MKLSLILTTVLSVILSSVAIAAPSGDGDTSPASYRGLPGSTYSHWTYDAQAPVPAVDGPFPRLDAPEFSSYVPHPNFGNPATLQQEYLNDWAGDYPGLDFTNQFSWQQYALSEWYGHGAMHTTDSGYGTNNMWMGREGVLRDVAELSWDINNFIDEEPLKKIKLQIVWKEDDTEDITASKFKFEIETFDPTGDDFVVFNEDPFENYTDLGDGWYHSVFEFEVEPNPDYEYITLISKNPASTGQNGGTNNIASIAVDEVVIDTISIPEPATISVLGLGSLLLARRKRRQEN